jgi:hypothetical protein
VAGPAQGFTPPMAGGGRWSRYRYLVLRDLCELPEEDGALVEARAKAHQNGPVSEVLAKMNPDGYWVEPGPGYNPKYRSTVWAVILLAQMGAKVDLMTASLWHAPIS